MIPAIVLAAGLVLLSALHLWHSHRDVTRQSEEAARNLVHVLAEHTERTFQAIDFTLLGVRDALTSRPKIPSNTPHFQADLKERLQALPYVRALIVIGPDGFLTHDTGYPATLRVNVNDRPYFQVHRDGPDRGLYIGFPIRSRADDTWVIGFSRRITQPDGSFGGVVAAAVDPLHFERFYRGLAVAQQEGGFIALLLRDGTLLARSPAAEDAMGRSMAAAEPFYSLLAGRREGVFWGTSPVDRVARVVGYRTVGKPSAVVLVGLARASVFKPWYQYAAVVLVTMAALLILIGLLLFLVRRSRQRESSEQERLNRVQRLEALGRIAGGIAHDFGNTIRIVLSTCALLRPSLTDDPEARSLVDDTERFLKSAKDMTERLLAFARRQELKPQVTMIDERIAEFASIMKQAAGPRVSVELRLASDGTTCLLDPIQFDATLLNLVLNARDAMPYGGTITVETRMIAPLRTPAASGRPTLSNCSWLQITIADEGVGMSPTVLEQAFDPFFTTKGPGQGSGLGLSQVLGFVQQSSGEVRLESKEGHGTRVHLVFPTVSCIGHNEGIEPCAAENMPARHRSSGVPSDRPLGET